MVYMYVVYIVYTIYVVYSLYAYYLYLCIYIRSVVATAVAASPPLVLG